jgi:hypothetical protein
MDKIFLLNKLDWLYIIFTFGYSVFSFTFTVIWSFRMEAAFIFFALDDPFRWTDKSEKCKESSHKNVSHKITDEKWWQRQLWFNFDKPSKEWNLKCHVTVCFSAVKKECFCLQLGFFFNFCLKTNSYAF